MPRGVAIMLVTGFAWAFAQILKVIVNRIRHKKVEWRVALSSGGMPSSHSALVCACASATGAIYGYTEPVFTLAVVFAVVVMYDAANVRLATGQQAKVLNYMMDHWEEEDKPDFFEEDLKEMIGHTPSQVAAGAVLGALTGQLVLLLI